MASTIKIKRGLKVNLPILERGELAYATDTKELFIGVLSEAESVSDNVLISDIDSFFTKSDFASLDGTGLVWNASQTRFDIDFADGTEALETNNLVKVMSPQRTDEAITARISATLATSDVASEAYVDGKINALPGTGLTLASGALNIDDPFDSSGTFANLRAQATTASDVGLGNVTNESKATMFTDPTFTGTVKVPLPSDPDAATNKSYVDQVAQGIKARSQALVLVGTPLAGTYDDQPPLHEFEAAANGAFPAVDGVSSETLNVVGARIVLAAQTNSAHNGLYVLKTVGDSETKWVLRRCTQCNTSEKIPGSFVFITKGTNFENTGWIFDVANPLTFVLGTDAINVIQFSGAGTFTEGNGLTLTGTVFAIDTAITMDLPSAQTVTGVKTFNETIVGSISGSAASLIETNTSTQAITIWTGSESDYGDINTKDNNTLYFIVED